MRLAIDDFGTGYSSLSYLRRLPVDVLKIDKAFVDEVATSPDAAALAQAIINLATTFGLATVAEGIEQPDQLQRLSDLGCQLGQGYYFAKPLDEEQLTALLRTQQPSYRNPCHHGLAARLRASLRPRAGAARHHQPCSRCRAHRRGLLSARTEQRTRPAQARSGHAVSQETAIMRYHPPWQPGQARTAAEGGADRRHAQDRGRAGESITRSAPSPGGHDQREPDAWTARGYASGPRRDQRRHQRRVTGPGHGWSWARTGRAAELASEAAGAEGASNTRHDQWSVAAVGDRDHRQGTE